jgi:hypothetical protein
MPVIFSTKYHAMKVSPFFLIIMCCISCSPIKESFIDLETGQKIAGYDKDCMYSIGRTNKSDIGNDEIDKMKHKLYFFFADDERQAIPLGKLVAVSGSPNMVTQKGIKAGDSVEKALKAYGKPKARVIDYGMDANGYVWWIFHGLFYENLTIVTDESYDKVLGVTIGRRKEFDIKLQKKYIR